MYTYFRQNSHFSYRFNPQVHTRMSLHQKCFKTLDQMGTIKTFGNRHSVKRNNLQTFPQSELYLLRNMHIKVFILVRRLVF